MIEHILTDLEENLADAPRLASFQRISRIFPTEVEANLDQNKNRINRRKTESSEEELPKAAEEVADWIGEDRKSMGAVRDWKSATFWYRMAEDYVQAGEDPARKRRRGWKSKDPPIHPMEGTGSQPRMAGVSHSHE